MQGFGNRRPAAVEGDQFLGSGELEGGIGLESLLLDGFQLPIGGKGVS